MEMSGAIAQAIEWFGTILWMCMIIRAIMSWFPGGRQGFLTVFLFTITEPFISPIRKLIAKSPLGGGMFDFSLIITLILLRVGTTALSNWVATLSF